MCRYETHVVLVCSGQQACMHALHELKHPFNVTSLVHCFAGRAWLRVRGGLQNRGQGHTGQSDGHQEAEGEAEAAGGGAEEEAGAGGDRRRTGASAALAQIHRCRPGRVPHPNADTHGFYVVTRHQFRRLRGRLQLPRRGRGAGGGPALPCPLQQPVFC